MRPNQLPPSPRAVTSNYEDESPESEPSRYSTVTSPVPFRSTKTMYKRRFSPDFRPVNSGKYFEGNEKYPTTDSETDEDVDEQIRFFSDEESLANGAMISSPKRASPLLLKRNFSQ